MNTIRKCLFVAVLSVSIFLNACNNGSSSSSGSGTGETGQGNQPPGSVPESPEAPPNNTSSGYFIAQLESSPHDLKKSVRVYIAGSGGSAGTLFQEAAISKAKKVKEIYPRDQILLIFYNESKIQSQKQKLSDWGLKKIQLNEKPLTDEDIYQTIREYQQVRSMDFFTHSAYDFALLSEVGAIIHYPGLQELRPLFSRDATVQFHGCNAGWLLAPALAKSWNVPVSGALTSTNFEQLHSNGNFYFNDAVTKPEGPWAKENKHSFNASVNCKNGGCLRMRPDNQPYTGVHGKLDVGLPYYRFFCGNLTRQECNRRMALTLPEFMDLTSSKEGKQKSKMILAAQNVLCPIHKSKILREACREGLKRSEKSTDKTYTPFQGISLHCGLNGCGKDISQKSTAFVDEYLNYLDGIEMIMGEKD